MKGVHTLGASVDKLGAVLEEILGDIHELLDLV